MGSSRVRTGYDLSPCISQRLINEMKQKGPGSLNPRLTHFLFTLRVRDKDLQGERGPLLCLPSEPEQSLHAAAPLRQIWEFSLTDLRGPVEAEGNLGREDRKEAGWHLRGLGNHEILAWGRLSPIGPQRPCGPTSYIWRNQVKSPGSRVHWTWCKIPKAQQIPSRIGIFKNVPLERLYTVLFRLYDAMQRQNHEDSKIINGRQGEDG